MSRKLMMGVIVLFMSVVLAACGGNDDTESDSNTNKEDNSSENSEMDEESDHSDMDPSSSGEVPDDLAKAEDPKYPVDSEAEITADHMEGMKGAIGTIEDAYDTTAYVVTYEPTDGGEKVENYIRVESEDSENEEGQSYEQGDEVVIEADHMEGMEGATAKIDSAEDTTVYMVSYEDTDTGEDVKNHKWVTEDELSEVK